MMSGSIVMSQKNQVRRRGSAVLDAALVFPILISLTFGCIEFGDFFYVKHTLQGAAPRRRPRRRDAQLGQHRRDDGRHAIDDGGGV